LRQNWIVVGSLSGALAVVLGAFGAHALKERLSPADLDVWHTAVLYQALHALALLAAGALGARTGRGAAAGWAFLAGSVLFSGSLYGLALGGPNILGPITPLGGLAFVLGWLLLAWAARGAMGRPCQDSE